MPSSRQQKIIEFYNRQKEVQEDDFWDALENFDDDEGFVLDVPKRKPCGCASCKISEGCNSLLAWIILLYLVSPVPLFLLWWFW